MTRVPLNRIVEVLCMIMYDAPVHDDDGDDDDGDDDDGGYGDKDGSDDDDDDDDDDGGGDDDDNNNNSNNGMTHLFSEPKRGQAFQQCCKCLQTLWDTPSLHSPTHCLRIKLHQERRQICP
jgi:hypothetical protein